MEGKVKVSFGIKTSKQGTLPKKVPETKSDVEYISSFDATIKPLGYEKPKEELVIPSKANKIGKEFLEDLKAKQEKRSEGDSTDNGNLKQSLDQLAVRELIEEVKGGVKNESKDSLSVPLPLATDAKEATLEDYESIPIEDFGKAMLRGMGWAPGTGIGKNQRIVAPVELQLRPKGMGLGADKMAVTNPVTYCTSSRGEKDVLSLANGCSTQIVAGANKGMYGKIVSHNEDTGRCVVKLEIGGSTVSVNENLLKPVTKEEYSSNARVLNADKFKKYKESSEANLSRKEKESSRSNRDGSPETRKSYSDSRRRRERSRSPVK